MECASISFTVILDFFTLVKKTLVLRSECLITLPDRSLVSVIGNDYTVIIPVPCCIITEDSGKLTCISSFGILGFTIHKHLPGSSRALPVGIAGFLLALSNILVCHINGNIVDSLRILKHRAKRGNLISQNMIAIAVYIIVNAELIRVYTRRHIKHRICDQVVTLINNLAKCQVEVCGNILITDTGSFEV